MDYHARTSGRGECGTVGMARKNSIAFEHLHNYCSFVAAGGKRKPEVCITVSLYFCLRFMGINSVWNC